MAPAPSPPELSHMNAQQRASNPDPSTSFSGSSSISTTPITTFMNNPSLPLPMAPSDSESIESSSSAGASLSFGVIVCIICVCVLGIALVGWALKKWLLPPSEGFKTRRFGGGTVDSRSLEEAAVEMWLVPEMSPNKDEMMMSRGRLIPDYAAVAAAATWIEGDVGGMENHWCKDEWVVAEDVGRGRDERKELHRKSTLGRSLVSDESESDVSFHESFMDPSTRQFMDARMAAAYQYYTHPEYQHYSYMTPDGEVVFPYARP
ncbi:hypothetical protein HDU98_009378 [Podochytrium sp. JEL0797]|nr:hypothetical protein HDU98_009378 [Podochytrium sp. JEL0797]